MTGPFAGRRTWKFIGVLALTFSLLLGVHLLTLRASGNIHPVVQGECYRSAQLDAAQLEAVITRHNIKTVINLRGAKPGAGWYDEERRTTRSHGVEQIDFPMSDRKELSFLEATRLVEAMHRAPKPVLIHCKAGSDRTGLACALYLAAIKEAGEETSERQLSLRYGHFSLPLTPAWAMDRTFEKLEPWLGYHGS